MYVIREYFKSYACYKEEEMSTEDKEYNYVEWNYYNYLLRWCFSLGDDFIFYY